MPYRIIRFEKAPELDSIVETAVGPTGNAPGWRPTLPARAAYVAQKMPGAAMAIVQRNATGTYAIAPTNWTGYTLISVWE